MPPSWNPGHKPPRQEGLVTLAIIPKSSGSKSRKRHRCKLPVTSIGGNGVPPIRCLHYNITTLLTLAVTQRLR
ncbi:hypothetical protein X975_12143, partial [Stegodyphus mimosarum]